MSRNDKTVFAEYFALLCQINSMPADSSLQITTVRHKMRKYLQDQAYTVFLTL